MRHRVWAGALIAIVMTLFILACGRETPTAVPSTPIPATAVPPTKTPTQTVAPTATPSPTPTPVVGLLPEGVSGGSLIVAGSAGFPHRDVHQSVQESLTSLGPGIAYSRLLRLKTSPDQTQPNLIIECDLCQSWTLTDDLVYEFQLRPQVRWQDLSPVNGRPLMAEDLVFSYKRMGSAGWPNESLASQFVGLEATAVGSFSAGLALPDADALLSLADGHAKVVAPEVVDQFGDLKDSPVIGTGPWIWDGTREDGGTNFSRNNDYFEPGAPFLDELVITVVKDTRGAEFPGEGRLAAFLAGQVDVTALPPEAWRSLEASGTGFDSFLSLHGGSGVVLTFNVQDLFFADENLRKAAFRAMDPWDYVDTLWSGQGSSGLGIPVPETDWLLSKGQIRGEYFADPTRSRALLNALDDSASREIQLTVWSEPGAPIYASLGDKIAEDLRAANFKVTVRRLNPDQFQQMVMGPDRDFQIAMGVLPPAGTSNGYLLALLHSGGRWNIANHADSELDSMIEAQAVDFNLGSRKGRLEEIQRHILDRAYVFSPVTGATRWAFRPDLKGFHPNAALSEYIHWSRVWLEP